VKNALTFKTICSHIVEIKSEETEFFGDSDKSDFSITVFNEDEIVDWIASNSLIIELLVNELCGIPLIEVDYKLRVKQPLLDLNEQNIIGDIDMIIIPKSHPEKSVIIEFKRVKVSSLVNGGSKLNKLRSAKNKGFSQIKKLIKFKYWKTYIGLIIEDDSRNIKTINTLTRTTIDQNIKKIYNINEKNELEEKAGLFFLKISQPTSEDFRLRFNFGICIDKHAQEQTQSNLTNKKIKRLVNY